VFRREQSRGTGLPWHSRDAGDMAVQDTYFESLLRPANWAEAVLE